MLTPSLPPNAAPTANRRKGLSARSWFAISSNQTQNLEDVEKHEIMLRTGLSAGDLRIFAPTLSYGSTILGREKAILIKLEHVKAVITRSEILVPDPTGPLIEPFVADLQAGFPVSEEVIPFEFKALKICLESACNRLEAEALTLEEQAYPAMDELRSKSSQLNLQRVPRIKSGLVALTFRVQKAGDKLESILNDDMHMAKMYLTEKSTSNQVDEGSFTEDPENDDSDMGGKREEQMKEKSASSLVSYSGSKHNNDELKMILEAYFGRIDGILQKLFKLREHVDDTMLMVAADKQNKLLQNMVMVGTFLLIVWAADVVASKLGMNINKIWHVTLIMLLFILLSC